MNSNTTNPQRKKRFSSGRAILSTIAAVVIIGLLIGSFIVLLNQARQGNTGRGNKTPTVVPVSPTVIVKNAGLITSIHMIDTTTGWALTNQAVLRTGDGGAHWQDVTPAKYPAQPGAAGTFLSASTAWVATEQPGNSPLQVFHTTNAGQTWGETTIAYSSGIAGATMTFINAQDGWILASLGVAAGSEGVAIFRTTDGGQTWKLVSNTQPPDNITPGALPLGGDKNGLSFLNPSTGWATGAEPSNRPWLYTSHDGGQTWQQQVIQLPPDQVNAELSITPPTFFNATEGILPINGLAAGSSTVEGSDIYVTHDGGATWTSTTLLAAHASTVSFLDLNHGWVADGTGTILYMTSDGGQSWTKITPGGNFKSITQLDFVSSQVGLAIGYTDSGNPFLLKTTDGGQTWVQVNYAVYTFKTR